MTEIAFQNYKPAFGTWSGYPENIKATDFVEVIFAHEDKPIVGYANEFGWNKCDIWKYRKITDVKVELQIKINNNISSPRDAALFMRCLKRLEEVEDELKSIEKLYDATNGHI